MDERRRFPRLNTLVEITFEKYQPPSDQQVTVAKNIGRGGICLISYEKVNVGEPLKVTINLPEKTKAINAFGKVAWVKEFVIGDASEDKRFDVGLDFTDINDEDRELIGKYVFEHLANP